LKSLWKGECSNYPMSFGVESKYDPRDSFRTLSRKSGSSSSLCDIANYDTISKKNRVKLSLPSGFGSFRY
jgi:hypothetical protein